MRASRLQGWELHCRVGVGGHAKVCVRSQGSLSSLSGGGAEICKRRAALTTGAHLRRRGLRENRVGRRLPLKALGFGAWL